MNRIADRQKKRNDQTRDGWDCFGPHRNRVSRLLADAAPEDGRLCVLGAGNANDLDLPMLLDAYSQIHLVDLDAHALRFGISRQGCENSNRVCLHGNVDVTSATNRLDHGWPEQPPSDAELNACMADHPPLDLPSPFDTVASVCLLTQLLDSIVMTMGEGHPRFVEMVQRMRSQHLRLLLELLRPGGTAVLVLDFVSSQACPELREVPEADLTGKAIELVNQRNFFTGVNPFVIRQLFESDPDLSPFVASVQMTQPWLWDFGPRVYLVCAMLVQRRLLD